MSVHVISITVLLVLFVIATVRPVNLGALALVASVAVGVLVVGNDVKTVLSGFPVDVFVLLLGVTYLFAIASVNGTIDRIVDWAAGLLRGNRTAIPWALFVLAALPTTMGAAGPAGIAMLAPITMRMAQKYGVNPRLAAVMLVQGSNAGNLSPLNVLGVIVYGTAERNGLGVDRVALWLGNVAFSAILAGAAFVLLGGLRDMRLRRSAVRTPAAANATTGADTLVTPAGGSSEDAGGVGASGEEREPTRPGGAVFLATVAAILAVGVGALVLGLDIGVLALSAALLLQLAFPTSSEGALAKVSWGTILLIGGVVTYVALLQRAGTVEVIGNSVGGISAPLVAALVLCAIAAVVSAFASSIGVLGALIPLSLPVLTSGAVPVTGLLLALAISATAVDATPFSSIGALTVASAPEDARGSVYNGLMRWGFAMVIVAPLATWMAFVVI